MGVKKASEKVARKTKKEASFEIARQLIEQGVDREIIKLSTGLDDTELRKLFNNKPESHY